jgi:hypothetical protein
MIMPADGQEPGTGRRIARPRTTSLPPAATLTYGSGPIECTPRLVAPQRAVLIPNRRGDTRAPRLKKPLTIAPNDDLLHIRYLLFITKVSMMVFPQFY